MVCVQRTISLSTRSRQYPVTMARGDSRMRDANDSKNSLLFNLRVPKLQNAVVRDVRDRDSRELGWVIEPHDGTEAGVIAAAEAATDRMYSEFATASNVESRICATDASGNPRWAVAPNFCSLAEVGTEEARYIWHGPSGEQPNPVILCVHRNAQGLKRGTL